MQEWIVNYLAQYRPGFFLAQTVTVISLFLLGLFFVYLAAGEPDLLRILLAFPAGLSLYVVAGMILLVGRFRLCIPYMAIVLLLILAAAFAGGKLFHTRGRTGFFKGRTVLLTAGIVLLIAGIACSGIFPISLSNDSMYYYSLYPRALATYGELRKQYNVFLTDVGLGSALIGTLPYFFGFNETFGIQWAFHINFLLFFAYMIRRRTTFPGTTAASVLLLITAMPFVILSRWAMSNFYFMEYFFLCVLTADELLTGSPAGEKMRAKGVGGKGELVLLSLLTVALSTLRMEGMVFVIFAVVAYTLSEERGDTGEDEETVVRRMNRGGWIANMILLPCFLLHGLYFYRIFVQMEIIAAYTFLSKGKAVLELLVIAVLYVLLIGKVKITNNIKGKKTQEYRLFTVIRALMEHGQELVLVILILVNCCLLYMDHSLYIENLKAFGRNLTHQSGWGVFPIAVFSIMILILLCRLMDHRKEQVSLSYMDFIVLGYVLITLVVSFARGDPMQESFGDSGNRVLMQITPLVVFALSEHLDEMISG